MPVLKFISTSVVPSSTFSSATLGCCAGVCKTDIPFTDALVAFKRILSAARTKLSAIANIDLILAAESSDALNLGASTGSLSNK